MSGLFDVVSDSAPAIEYELQNAGNFQDIEQIARDARARSSNSLQAPSAITSESDSHAPSAVERSKVWLDCDPGHDDAIAMILAGHNPHIHLLGISTVGGNQTIEKTTQNALKVMQVSGLQHVELVAGASRPLLRKTVVCPEIHGESGLDGPIFPALTCAARPEKAVLRMFEVFKQHASRGSTITLIATGPLTNVALLLMLYPEVKPFISRIVFLGGARGIGNTGPVAEFNIQVDPEAAHVVMESGLPIVMVPLEVTHTALVVPDIVHRIEAIGSRPASTVSSSDKLLQAAPSPFPALIVTLLNFFARTYREVFGFEFPPLHDPCAVAYVINPALFVTRHMRVDVEMHSPLSYGQTVCDTYGMSTLLKNVHVALSMDVPAFWDLIIAALEKANAVSRLNQPAISDAASPSAAVVNTGGAAPSVLAEMNARTNDLTARPSSAPGLPARASRL